MIDELNEELKVEIEADFREFAKNMLLQTSERLKEAEKKYIMLEKEYNSLNEDSLREKYYSVNIYQGCSAFGSFLEKRGIHL